MNPRAIAGAVVGGAIAGIAYRVRQLTRDGDKTLAQILPELPAILQADVQQLATDVREAASDGTRAAAEKQAEVDQHLNSLRTVPGPDDKASASDAKGSA